MIHVTLIMEDTTIVATQRNETCNTPDGVPLSGGIVTALVTDNLTGKSVQVDWTLEQWQAVMVLAIAGDDFFSDVQDPNAHLYEIAEKALIGFPSEVRPIP